MNMDDGKISDINMTPPVHYVTDYIDLCSVILIQQCCSLRDAVGVLDGDEVCCSPPQTTENLSLNASWIGLTTGPGATRVSWSPFLKRSISISSGKWLLVAVTSYQPVVWLTAQNRLYHHGARDYSSKCRRSIQITVPHRAVCSK